MDTAVTMRRIPVLVILALAALLVTLPESVSVQAGESTDAPAPLALQPQGQLPLEGTPWRLVGYRFNGVARGPGPEVAARMTLQAGDVDASGGCTAFGGSYGVMGGAISFDLKQLKENDCAEQTTIVQLGLVEGLRKAARYEISPSPDGSGDELVLYSASDNEVLRFGLDDIGAISGVEWHLAAYTVGGFRTVADASQPSVLIFSPDHMNMARRVSDGRMTGSSGCNGFSGDFYRAANVLSFGELSRTEAACTPEILLQENAIISVLDATAIRLALSPDRLFLTSADSDTGLELVSSQTVEGSTWLLKRINGAGGPGDIVTLRLDGGRLSGEGPCGPYTGRYVSDGVFITFADLAGADDGSCEHLGAEKNLLAALRAAVVLERSFLQRSRRAQLLMRDARGATVLRFDAATLPWSGN